MRHAIACVALWAAGCGSASALDVCNRACSKTIGCTGGTTDQIAQCQNNCQMTTDQQNLCANSGDIVSCTNGCLGAQNCNDLADCVKGCPKCVLQSGVDLASGGGGNDMAMGGGGPDLATGNPLEASCNGLCEKITMCMGGTAQTCEMQLLNCPSLSPANCSNALAVETCWDGCAQGSCNALITCAQACPRCM